MLLSISAAVVCACSLRPCSFVRQFCTLEGHRAVSWSQPQLHDKDHSRRWGFLFWMRRVVGKYLRRKTRVPWWCPKCVWTLFTWNYLWWVHIPFFSTPVLHHRSPFCTALLARNNLQFCSLLQLPHSKCLSSFAFRDTRKIFDWAACLSSVIWGDRS